MSDAILDFHDKCIWHVPLWRWRLSVFLELRTKLGSNILYHWERPTFCSRYSTDNVMQINFRFRFLVTWASARGRVAFLYQILCKYIHPVGRLLLAFYEIQYSRRRPSCICMGEVVEPPTKSHSWARMHDAVVSVSLKLKSTYDGL